MGRHIRPRPYALRVCIKDLHRNEHLVHRFAWLFGDPGYSIIWFNTAQESLVPRVEKLVAIERIKRLFPEAQIGFMYTPPKRPQPVPEKTRQSGSAYDGFKL